ncbi:MAG: hypothetical protein KIS78_21190 [Labilithrix sp.]|nr:hypothetical protein [Labilithrix sp.]MCW5834930.1 hypothetical protein [Labilithrix sp.]
MKANLGIASVLAAAAAAVVASPSDARAAGHANGFGEKGQLILSADRLVPVFNYASSSVTRTENNVELTRSRSGSGLSLLFGRSLAHSDDLAVPVNVHTIPRVAFDVTIIPQLTLGAAIAFGFGLGGTNENENLQGTTRTSQESDAPTATAIGLAPRVGYILPLGDVFAFWPRVGFGFYSVSATTEQTQGNTTTTVRGTDTLFSLDLDPQFAIIPLEHFFIHVGPVINIPISGSRSVSSTTGATTTRRSDDASLFNLGVSAGLGGWLNVF